MSRAGCNRVAGRSAEKERDDVRKELDNLQQVMVVMHHGFRPCLTIEQF